MTGSFTRRVLQLLPIYLAVLFSDGSSACSVPPATLSQPDELLVQSSDTIVLARVVDAESAVSHPPSERKLAVFHFETIEALKGNPPKRFQLEGIAAGGRRGDQTDFAAHSKPEFWEGRLENSVMPGNCSAYGLFDIGGTYLIFLRKQSHRRAFENIRSASDQWLKHVRLLVEKPVETYVAKGPNGLTMKLELFGPLDGFPPSGWLNSAKDLIADGTFGGSVKKPLQIVTKTGSVVLERDKRGDISAGRYYIENGTLAVCMLSPAPRGYRNVIEMAVPENYTLCASMERVSSR